MVRIKVGVFSVRADAFSNPAQNRWLLVEFLPVDDGALVLSEKTIWAAVKQSVVHNFGDAGWGGIGVSLSGKLPFSVDSIGANGPNRGVRMLRGGPSADSG